MKQRRMALVHYSCHPVVGGVEFILEGHAKVFASKGHEVKVIVGRGEKFAEGIEVIEAEELKKEGTSAARVQEELDRGEVTENFRKRKERIKKRLRRELEDEDVCIVHNVMTMHFDLALTAAVDELMREMGNQVRFVVWCHDATLNDPNYSPPKRGEFPWSLLSSHNDKALYVTISDDRRKRVSKIIGLEPEKMLVVPDAVDAKALMGISDHIWEMALELGLLSDGVTMLFPARIVRRKNFELGVRIVSEMKRLGERCHLLITGPPDHHNPATVRYYEELHKLKRELDADAEVVFLHDCKEKYLPTGGVSFEDLKDLYALSDVLLITSKQEGFCIPLLEAGVLRMPVACVNVPPLPEVVGEDALLFGLEEEPASIARRILEMLNANKSTRLFKRVMGKYSWEAIYGNYLSRLVE